jgi:hypothetical protein
MMTLSAGSYPASVADAGLPQHRVHARAEMSEQVDRLGHHTHPVIAPHAIMARILRVVLGES